MTQHAHGRPGRPQFAGTSSEKHFLHLTVNTGVDVDRTIGAEEKEGDD